MVRRNTDVAALVFERSINQAQTRCFIGAIKDEDAKDQRTSRGILRYQAHSETTPDASRLSPDQCRRLPCRGQQREVRHPRCPGLRPITSKLVGDASR